MRVALVTGSSGGRGRHIAHRLGRDGFAVAVNGLDAEEAEIVARAIRDEGGVAEAFTDDATDEEEIESSSPR